MMYARCMGVRCLMFTCCMCVVYDVFMMYVYTAYACILYDMLVVYVCVCCVIFAWCMYVYQRVNACVCVI